MSLRSRRWVASAVLLVAFLVALLFFLLFSVSASQLMWNQLTRWVPGLQGEWVSGSLAEGWQLQNARWRNDAITVSLKHVQTKWTLASLLNGELALDELDVEGLTVSRTDSVSTEEQVAAAQDSVNSYISTPIPIQLGRLKVSDFLYDDSVVQVKVKELNTAANWDGHRIDIAGTKVNSVDVWLKPTVISAKPSVADKTSHPTIQHSTTAQSLPEVFVPFDIRLAELDLKQGRYHQQGFDTGLMDLQLQARFDGHALSVQKLSVQQLTALQDKRSAVLTGCMTFIRNYLLDTQLKVTSLIPGNTSDSPRTVILQTKGDLQDLSFTATLEGAEKLQLQGKLRPLHNDLPFEIHGNWQALPLPSALTGLSVGRGKIEAQGALSSYKLDLETEGKWRALPSSRLQLVLTGSTAQLQLQRLHLGDGLNYLDMTGLLNWKNGVHWQGQTDVSLPAVAHWLPETQAAVSGRLKQKLDWQNEQWQGELSSIALSGSWNGFPLTAQGAIQGNQKGNWNFQQVEIKNGPNSLALNGHLEQGWALAAKVRLPKLALISRQLDGSLDGDLRLNGPVKSPILAMRLAASRLVMPGQVIRDLAITGQATLDKALPGQLQINASRWNIDGTSLRNVALSLRGNAQKHQLTLTSEGKQFNTNLLLTGSWQKEGWQGVLQDGKLGGTLGDWQLQAPLKLQWKNNALALKAHCWRSAPAKLCFENASIASSDGAIPFALSGLDAQRVRPWLPENLNWNSVLQANGLLGWHKGAPNLRLSARSQHGEWVTEQVHTPYRDMQLQLDVNASTAKIVFLLDSDMLGHINVNAQVADPLKRRVLSGSVNVSDLQLYGVGPLVDVLHSTKGTVDIHGRLAGTLHVPLFYGQINLKDGEVDTATEMVSLKQINGSLLVEGDKATLNASMAAGKGKISLTGHSSWTDGIPTGLLALHGEQVELAFAGYGSGKVDSDLQLQFDADKVSLSGDVSVPWARVDVKNLPDNGVEVSDDVHIVRPLQQQNVSVPFPFMMDVNLTLGSDVRINAMGLRTALAGSLHFSQKPGQSLLTQGEIRLVNGRFKAYGQNLVIRSGKLLFNGDVTTPYVMAEAIRDPATMEDTSVTVGVKINAPITSISAQVFSEPELPDTDKLSYLLRGRSSTATTNGSTEEAMAAMMIGAGLGQANGVVSDVASTFGLKDATFDTKGSGTDTKVNLSAYVLKDLQLQYGVGVYSAVSEVTLRYFLLPQLYLQAVSSLSQAVDIFYKFEF
jgi:Uncharacterized protein conserved in bacteria